METEQVRREVCARLWAKARAPPAREAVTLLMRLMRGLLRSAFGPQSADDGDELASSSSSKKRQKLGLEEAERRWQAVFPDEPQLTTPLNVKPKRIACPKRLVDAVSVELKEGCGHEQVDQAVAQYCVRVLLRATTNVMLAAAAPLAAESDSAVACVTEAVIRRAISQDATLMSALQRSPALLEALKVREQPSLSSLCAKLVAESKVDYRCSAISLPDEVIDAIAKHDKAETMRRLLARIDAYLPALQATRKPVTDEEFADVETEFQLKFPPELRAYLEWSDGTPDQAPAMDQFVTCFGIKLMHEEFFYNDVFPTLFRQMKWIPIAPLDYDMAYHALDIDSGMVIDVDIGIRLESTGLIDGVRAYVELLEQHKDDLKALERFELPRKPGMQLKHQAPDIYARYRRNTDIYRGSDYDSDDYDSGDSEGEIDEENFDEEEEEDDEEEEEEEEFELQMNKLNGYKMPELREFAAKHHIKVFGRGKADVVNAILKWRDNRKREAKRRRRGY